VTARPLRRKAESEKLRVLKGRRRSKRSLAPWMIMAVIGVVAFLGLGFARTSLDKSAFELDEIDKAVAQADAVNRQLSLEIARLENPARIAPLAEELGMVIPVATNQILVDLDDQAPVFAEIASEEENQ
jgi:cell division protein FtsL